MVTDKPGLTPDAMVTLLKGLLSGLGVDDFCRNLG
jgi:hypothetical protein